ncbi:hypothetical protein SY2F82_50010 [Streptomyces sp. Y2F8-2]|nr:hypothetical protein SY2F82_50010 [Streptomyces sp. Y2F8-2]
MDSRSSRLLSGRRVPSRHSARFISRSALAMAIDALRLPMVLTTDDRTAREHPGKSRGPTPAQAWTQLIVSGRLQAASRTVRGRPGLGRPADCRRHTSKPPRRRRLRGRITFAAAG